MSSKIASGELTLKDIWDAVEHRIPTLLFLGVPLFAVFLKIFYLGSGKYYVEQDRVGRADAQGHLGCRGAPHPHAAVSWGAALRGLPENFLPGVGQILCRARSRRAS